MHANTDHTRRRTRESLAGHFLQNSRWLPSQYFFQEGRFYVGLNEEEVDIFAGYEK